MLRRKPKVDYCGLTIILSNPSRFDLADARLLTGQAGTMLSNHCLAPEFNLLQCDVRLMEDASPFLDGTKCILLLGEAAMHHFCPSTKDNTLNEMRGSPLYVNNIPAIATFFAQDAVDRAGHEQRLNTYSKDYVADDEDDDDEQEDNVKSYSPTKRRNYAFFVQRDVKKVKHLLTNKLTKWPVEPAPDYRIYPDADEVIHILTNTKGQFLDFDMETDYAGTNLLCFAFTFDNKTIYSVPVLDNNWLFAYANIGKILRALAIAIRDNTLVAHNGHSFDFFVLAHKYSIMINKAYDTMLAMHRCFPDIEKSLGHGTSIWTYQTFHKDTDSEAYYTNQQMMQKLLYCAKDVFTMSLIRRAVTVYAKTIPGLEDSIALANASVRPYLTTTMQGIRYIPEQLRETMTYNDRLMTQYLRIINILLGEGTIAHLRSRSKNGKVAAFPSSNPQCIEYFHNMLGYSVVARTKENAQGERNPSLGKLAMFKLALKYENPVIRFTLLFRTLKKESGSLKFIPWRDSKGKIIDRDVYGERPELVDTTLLK